MVIDFNVCGFNVYFPSWLPSFQTHTNSFILRGIWTARQMFCNGNHFYLDFFPLGIWRNVRCSDLSSRDGNWMKVLLKKLKTLTLSSVGMRDPHPCFHFPPTLSNSLNTFFGEFEGRLCVPPAWTRAPSHYGCQAPSWKHRIRHVDLSFSCLLLDAEFASEHLRFIPL